MQVALLQQVFFQPRLDAFAKQRAIRQYHGGAAILLLVLAFLVVAGNAHDVALVQRNQVGVLIDERLPHQRGVFRVDAKHDRLLIAVAALFQKFCDLAGNQFRAVIEHDVPVKVLDVIDPVFDLIAVTVELTFLWPVALNVAVDVDLDDLVGGKEAVADTLAKRIREGGRTEVVDVGNVFGFLRRGG